MIPLPFLPTSTQWCLDGALGSTYVDWKLLSYAIVILEPDICMAAKHNLDWD